MKTLGMIRSIDNLGRMVIPKEIRTQFGLKYGTPMEILVSGGDIILRKVGSRCNCCGGQCDLIRENNLCVCIPCLKRLVKEHGEK